MKVYSLKKERIVNDIPIWSYLIANGSQMGRWTLHFGVHCLADSPDTIGYLNQVHEENPNSIKEEWLLTLVPFINLKT